MHTHTHTAMTHKTDNIFCVHCQNKNTKKKKYLQVGAVVFCIVFAESKAAIRQ